MRITRLFLLAAVPFLLGPGCLSNTVYEVDLGDYVLRYRQVGLRSAYAETLLGSLTLGFSATLERTGTPAVTGPIAVSVSTNDAGTEILAGDLLFPPPSPGPVATASPFQIRQVGAFFVASALQFSLSTETAPALLASNPAPGASVAPSAWLILEFASAVHPAALLGFGLDCGGGNLSLAAHAVEAHRIAVNPAGDLPTGAACTLGWTGPSGATSLAFAIAVAGSPATVVYDRADVGLFPPFPDDTVQVIDPSTLTGRRNEIPVPVSRPPDVRNLAIGLIVETNQLNGWSPQAGLVLLLSEAPDLTTLPQSAEDSLDPLASIGLFDVDPASPRFGERHPFVLSARADALPGDAAQTHQLVLFPSRPLEPRGRYALAVTRRALATGLRPFAADSYYLAAQAAAQPGEAPITAVTRGLLDEILPILAEDVSPPLPADDLALALSISIRSIASIKDDPLAMKAHVTAAAAPSFVIDSAAAGSGDTAAVIRGRWQAPSWLTGPFLSRVGGVLQNTGTRELPFVMTLPVAALDGPVPIILYQHGNPGSSEEVVGAGGRLSSAGFAVIGFTDMLNVDFADSNAQFLGIFGLILISQDVPDFYVETYGQQMGFLRLIESLSTLDLLPLGTPDGVPDVDPTLPLTYEGISFGGVHGGALMPYAPEIRAAALVAGGGNFAERLFLQDVTDPLGTGSFFFTVLPGAIPNVRVSDIWVGLQLFQTIFDDQDPNLHAMFTYGDRQFPVNGTLRKPSILIVQGITDSFSPENALFSEAFASGPIQQLPPIAVPGTVLEQVTDPVNVANVDGETTAGLVQYVPAGVAGVPASAGCAFFEFEGHFCAQGAPEAIFQRTAFYRTAVDDGVPTIFDPAHDGDGDGRPDAREIAEGTDPGVAD